MSAEDASNAVAVLHEELSKQYRTHPIVGLASKAAADLNDVLNAVSLRLALLRWQTRETGSRTEVDFGRLSGLIEQAALMVHALQEHVRGVGHGEAKPAASTEDLSSARPHSDRRKSSATTELKSERWFESRHAPVSILVVDSKGEEGRIRTGLEQGGYSVTVARPEDALKLLFSANQFDSVLCDVSVLERDGRGFAAAVASAAPTAKLYLLTRDK